MEGHIKSPSAASNQFLNNFTRCTILDGCRQKPAFFFNEQKSSWTLFGGLLCLHPLYTERATSPYSDHICPVPQGKTKSMYLCYITLHPRQISTATRTAKMAVTHHAHYKQPVKHNYKKCVSYMDTSEMHQTSWTTTHAARQTAWFWSVCVRVRIIKAVDIPSNPLSLTTTVASAHPE